MSDRELLVAANPLRIAVFGGPDGAALVARSIHALAAAGAHIRLLGYLDDALPRGTAVSGAPVLGRFAAWSELPEDVTFLAPLHEANEMPARAILVAGLGVPDARWVTVIDPRSAVARDAEIGRGCFVGPFATVGPAARLGSHAMIRDGAHVSHDCTLGDFVHVGQNAILCGSATVEVGAYVAPAAVVRDGCRVGRFATVGLGAVVIEDVPDGAIVFGNPAHKSSSAGDSAAES